MTSYLCDRRPRRSATRREVVGRLSIALAGVGAAGRSWAAGQDPLPAAIAELAGIRSRCEELAIEVRASVPSDSAKERRAEMLYGRTKAASDAWLAFVRLSLSSGRSLDRTEEARLQREVAACASEFIAYGESLFPTHRKGVLASVGELLPQIVDAGVKIWSAWQSASTAQRKEILTELEAAHMTPYRKLVV